MYRKINITIEDIENTSHLTIHKAAELLNVGTATIVRARKKFGLSTGRIGRWTSKVDIEVRICNNCNSEFEILETYDKIFCNRTCYNEYKREHPLEYKNSEEQKSIISKKAKERWKNPTENMLAGIEKRKNDELEPYKKYRYKVGRLTEETYEKNKDEINPHGHVRTLAGVEDGYHLDHIISCKYGFDNDISPEELAKKSNLQMLPWRDNIVKGK